MSRHFAQRKLPAKVVELPITVMAYGIYDHTEDSYLIESKIRDEYKFRKLGLIKWFESRQEADQLVVKLEMRFPHLVEGRQLEVVVIDGRLLSQKKWTRGTKMYEPSEDDNRFLMDWIRRTKARHSVERMMTHDKNLTTNRIQDDMRLVELLEKMNPTLATASKVEAEVQ